MIPRAQGACSKDGETAWTMKGFFLVGLQYWPARKGVYWWKDFDVAELEADFKRIRQMSVRVVRIQLVWEDFQPTMERVDPTALEHLRQVLDTAARYKLKVQPSFFAGHLSGVNFLPPWMLTERDALLSPYPVYSNGRLIERAL